MNIGIQNVTEYIHALAFEGSCKVSRKFSEIMGIQKH